MRTRRENVGDVGSAIGGMGWGDVESRGHYNSRNVQTLHTSR